jgi:hypothetical protein
MTSFPAVWSALAAFLKEILYLMRFLVDQLWPPLRSTFLPPIWSNWALVIAAAYAARVALKTLGAIHRQADVAAHELVTANRAYLYLSGVRIKRLESSVESNLEITYLVYNGGQTPAMLSGDFSKVTLYRRAYEIPRVGNEVTQRKASVIPPRGADPMNGKHWTMLGDDELDDIRSGNRKLCFYGFLFYQDVFDYWHKTWFALSYNGPLEIGESKFMDFMNEFDFNRFE